MKKSGSFSFFDICFIYFKLYLIYNERDNFMIDTKTIDVELVKRMLFNCRYYDQIINYEYKDNITKCLIEWYRDVIFKREIVVDNIRLIDYNLYLYINNYHFRRSYKKYIVKNNYDYIRGFMKFIKIKDKYLFLDVDTSRWL